MAHAFQFGNVSDLRRTHLQRSQIEVALLLMQKLVAVDKPALATNGPSGPNGSRAGRKRRSSRR